MSESDGNYDEYDDLRVSMIATATEGRSSRPIAMATGARMLDVPPDEEGVLWSELLYLSELRLSDLDRIPPSALVESVRRILDESGKQPTTYSQYQANI